MMSERVDSKPDMANQSLDWLPDEQLEKVIGGMHVGRSIGKVARKVAPIVARI